MPWQHFTGVGALWSVQPSFVVGQALFIGCALVALLHAWRKYTREDSRLQLLIWVGALVAGTANDLIFMALPLVDNFWHAQANIMLTARLPLYIPCVYVCFMYYPTVAVRRLRLNPLPQAALTGLAAVLFYVPYDITGAKFLWWTWHDTDLTVSQRILGAPASSTLWVLTFCGTFAWLIDRVTRRDEAASPKTFALGLVALAAFTTMLMVLQMTVLQQLDPLLGLKGKPGHAALAAGIALYAAVAWRGRHSASAQPSKPRDRLLYGALLAHFITFAAIMALADPQTHRSTGVHQTVGPCYVEAKDITGLTRHEFLCAKDFDEDFTFACAETPVHNAQWYTVCGAPHRNYPLWLSALSLWGLFGLIGYAFLLGIKPMRSH